MCAAGSGSGGDGALVPLPYEWVFRAHGACDLATYAVSYTHLFDVRTAADFWRLARAFLPGTVFLSKRWVTVRGRTVNTFTLFRQGVLPEWEHPSNQGGFTLTLRGIDSPSDLDALWFNLLLDCCRGTMGDSVVGVQVTRKPDRKLPLVKVDVWCHASATQEHVLDLLASVSPLARRFTPSRRA